MSQPQPEHHSSRSSRRSRLRRFLQVSEPRRSARRAYLAVPERAYCAVVSVWGRPPRWLEEPVAGVMADLQGALPIPGIVAAVAVDDTLNGVSLAMIEPSRLAGLLPMLPEAEELKPEPGDNPGGGGNFVPRGLVGPGLLARVAEILQEDLAGPKSRGAKLGRLAHTIRTPRARWCVTVRRGGSVSDVTSACIASAEVTCPYTCDQHRPGLREVTAHANVGRDPVITDDGRLAPSRRTQECPVVTAPEVDRAAAASAGRRC